MHATTPDFNDATLQFDTTYKYVDNNPVCGRLEEWSGWGRLGLIVHCFAVLCNCAVYCLEVDSLLFQTQASQAVLRQGLHGKIRIYLLTYCTCVILCDI